MTATSLAGWNRLKIAIADSGDEILDSNVFIECERFIVPTRRAELGAVKARHHRGP